MGLQGVSTSSALLVLEATKKAQLETEHVILFKWQREKNLFESLLGWDHEASEKIIPKYRQGLEEKYDGPLVVTSHGEPKSAIVSRDTMERLVGKNASEVLRRRSWLDILRRKKVILIDTPDYSKTDKRAMAKDLNDIYWLWINLSKKTGRKPNIVLAVQKEMLGSHFFFDKMQKIELEPLQSEQILEAYMKPFKSTKPFTEEALLTLARMSRGIFRRFLRYVSLTSELWLTYPEPRQPIDRAVVKQAVTLERLTEDMELELASVFPRQSDAPRQAVQLLMHLEESRPTETR